VRKKLKGFLIKTLIFLFLFLCLTYPNGIVFSKAGFSESEQSLQVGLSYLRFQKSFLDFPIVWKSTMPLFSASYQIDFGKFSLQISLDYGRSTFIDVNDLRKSGKNYFSILAFNYDLMWHKLRHTKNPIFFWGLGASLENLEIVQKIEICPGKYNKNKDQYWGLGPKLNLLWRFNKAQFVFSLGSVLPVPYASFGLTDSDIAFTSKSYLWWFEIKTNLYYKYRISRNCDLLVGFNRDAFVYGRTQRFSPKPDNFFAGGSYIFRSIEMALNYNF
jgi:hypothetical protein